MLGKTSTFTRYTVDPSLLRWDAVEESAFDRLPPSSTPKMNGQRLGWCHPDNALLPPEPAACKHEPWWIFGLRIDAWKKPSSFKHKLDLRKRVWLEDSGRERVPAAIVRELTEQLFLETAETATRLVPVAVCTQTGEIWLGSVSGPIQAAFETAWGKALPESLLQRKISEHLGSHRFLLWLWWRIEQGHKELHSEGRLWDIWVDEQLEFSGGGSASRVRGGNAGTLRPSYASLTAGLQLLKLRLGLSSEGRDRSVMLGRPPEEIRSLKFTAEEPEVDAQLYAVQEVLGVIDELDRQYASIASDPDRLTQLEESIDRWKRDWDRTLAPATTEDPNAA